MKPITDDMLKLALFYLIAHGWILFLVDAVYWDDWVLWNMSNGDVFRMFELAGSPFNMAGYLHVFMLNGGPIFYKAVILLLNLSTGLLLYEIVRKMRLYDDRIPYYTALVFLITPLFIARVTMITLPYSLCLFLFALGWYLYEKKKLLSLTAFLLSFNIPSLLVFYSIPVLSFIYLKENKIDLIRIINWTKTNLHFVSIPFIYYGIHKFLFSPTSFYEGYNRGFDVRLLLTSLEGIVTDALQLNVNLIFITTMLIGAVYYFNKSKNEIIAISSNRVSFYVIVLALFMAWFPYGILGYSPQFFEWNSRHQLVLIFGLAFLFTHIFILLKEYRIIILSVVVSVSLCMNVINYKNLFFDWNKQKQIIALLTSTDKIEKGAFVLFTDHTKDINALSRSYRFYEWNGMMKYAYGEETRFGMNNDEHKQEYITGNLDRYFDSLYAAKSHLRTDITVDVEIHSKGLKYYLLVDDEKVEGNYRLRDSFRSLNELTYYNKTGVKRSK